MLTKVHTVKAMVFLVVIYRYESWTMKKAECRRIDAFKLWYWRRLLRVPWTARSNQSILKEINPEYSFRKNWWLKLKHQYFGHLMQRADLLKKTLMMGKIVGRRRRWQQTMRCLDHITESTDMLLLLLSSFSCVRLCATPQMAAHQALLSLGFSRQEQWSGLPFPSPMHESEKWKWSRSVVSDSSWPHGLQPTRLLHPWDSLGKSAGVGCHCLLHQRTWVWANSKTEFQANSK